MSHGEKLRQEAGRGRHGGGDNRLFLTLPVFYYVIEMPPFAVGIAALFYAILAIAMVYYAMERFKEIDEGLDDAVDDY